MASVKDLETRGPEPIPILGGARICPPHKGRFPQKEHVLMVHSAHVKRNSETSMMLSL